MTATTMQVGRYRVSAVLGTGGFGTVYLARDRGRPVAVKVLDRAARSDPRTMAGVRTEATAMRRVRDRHCVRVLDVIDEETVTALVTEFVDGASLRAVLDRHGPLDGRQALDVMRGALLGLSAVHRAGMVHGDVKPANILIDRRGRARLIDFGLARDVGASAGSSDLTGSPEYMAPEQIRRLPPDPRSDIYACAAVLYELLTGRRPMQADTIPGVLRMHLEVTPADPRSINPEISPALAALCLSGLAKNPAERPQSARAFLDQLERAAKERYGAAWRRGLGLGALAGTTAAALGRGQLGRAGQRLVRLPQVAVGAGTAAVIVAGVVVATNHHTPKRASAAPSSSAAASGIPSAAPSHPTPRPTGHIVYSVGRSWQTISADGTGARKLAITGPLCCSLTTPSPDGTRLLYSGEGALFVGDSDGRNARTIWSSPYIELGTAAWSPSGNRIAFATEDATRPGPPRSHIYTVDADGSHLQTVATGVNIHSIAWSPDSARLAFTANQADIFLVGTGGGPVHVLFGRAQGEGPDELPGSISWGATGTILFDEVGAPPQGIWSIHADGTGLSLALRGGQEPSFAPDGVHFAAIANRHIIVAATDGSGSRTLGPAGVTSVHWGG